MRDPPVVITKDVLWFESIMLLGYAIMCFLCLLLIAYLRVNRREAFKGDTHASRKVILPAFEPLLWILAAATGVYVVFFSVAISIQMYTTGFPNLDREFFYAGRQFVFILVLMFFCEKSVSLSALRNATIKSLLLASYTLVIVSLLTRYAPTKTDLLFFVKLTTRPLLLIFVVYVCMIRPPVGRANPRALRMHAWFILIYHFLLVWYSLGVQYFQKNIAYPILTYTLLIWSSMCPLLIWWLLRADTEYWRGMGKRACALQFVNSQIQQKAIVNEGISSHGIHVLIEVHRKLLIDFAHLELKRKISSASSCVVFSGLLRSKHAVAVKVYTPQYFTEEVVAEFSHEAALCASLTHPNIVEFYGMCVSPPTIGLVSELCRCSLEDVLLERQNLRERRLTTWRNQGYLDNSEAKYGYDLDTQRMQLNVAYMLDCARAVAYLHSFSSPFLHRDIKPANFLLDAINTVKLTNFSDSRRLPNELPVSTASTSSRSTHSDRQSVGSLQPSPKSPSPLQPKMTVTGTVEYMAPEMIGSRTGLATYGEAADVYSLVTTFWDMLYPGREKYPDTFSNHLLVFEAVLGGARPPFDENSGTKDEYVPERLRDLIVSAWQKSPEDRPTAQQIVNELEGIQEEILAVLAQDLLSEFETERGTCSPMPAYQPFTGEHAVNRMDELKVIESKPEGLRLGRALLDAGFLHHVEHTCGFSNSDSSLYFLDEDNINYCQPLAILEELTDTSQESDGGPRTPPSYQQMPQQSSSSSKSKRPRLLSHWASTSPSNVHTGSESDNRSWDGKCACRLLGRLQDIPMTPRGGRHRRGYRLSANIYSDRGSIECAPAPQRWLRRKREPRDSLRRKLLDEVLQEHVVVDILEPPAL
ncbi:hypothetical protein PHYBOEH_003605 [Phytophthora boehmeriae]|uniref:Protein kinase domain-containing protein n=1 Tax=Phytophthora boehmeriae TaxID=109152 RepID=A0A8T1X4X8_9STRA|nr:hypothetical protein PHYBOEH_003605 [Phytophthora boehmeriae]